MSGGAALPVLPGAGSVEGHVLTYRGLYGRHAVLRIVLLWAWLMPCLACARGDDVAFVLPAQPLEQALERFSVASGWSVMYPGALAEGRTSAAVHGAMPPAMALEALLKDTGLAAEMVGNGRVVLRALEGADGPAPVAHAATLDPAQVRRAFARMQGALREVFCNDPLLAPGDYSARIAFQVDADGRIQHVELLVGSGQVARDQALLQAMPALQLPVAAAALPQPVTLDIRPVPASHDCGRRPSPP